MSTATNSITASDLQFLINHFSRNSSNPRNVETIRQNKEGVVVLVSGNSTLSSTGKFEAEAFIYLTPKGKVKKTSGYPKMFWIRDLD